MKSYNYAWLYNHELDAYIFCFKVNNRQEHAVIFKKDHAGVLLQKEYALTPFTIAITHKDFGVLKETNPVFMFNNIEIAKNEVAGWQGRHESSLKSFIN
ncbi:MAG: hypothetical protein Q8934_01075 [Bacillota bacterium]|nr:hypothetical protein [Bacillota bacterium]